MHILDNYHKLPRFMRIILFAAWSSRCAAAQLSVTSFHSSEARRALWEPAIYPEASASQVRHLGPAVSFYAAVSWASLMEITLNFFNSQPSSLINIPNCVVEP